MRLGHHGIAERREAHRALGALHQSDPQQRFEIAQAGGQGRLRDEAGIGGTAEMPVFVQGDEVLELLERGLVYGHAPAIA